MTMPFEPERVRALLFDIDGTLADSDNDAVELLAKLLSPLGHLLPQVDLPILARRLVMAVEGPLNLAYVLADRLALDELASWLGRLLPRRRRLPEKANLIPGVGPMLDRARRQFKLAVVTARGERGSYRFLRAAGLDGAFDAIVTNNSTWRGKPHPAPVLLAANALGVPPAACLMVGDTTLDVRAGVAAGAQTVGVLCGFGEQHELERAGAHLVLDSTADLLDHLII